AMLAKSVAQSETDGPKFIHRPFYCATAYVGAKVTKTSSYDSTLKRRGIVTGKWHKVNGATERERTVLERCCTAKNLRVAQRTNIEVFENGFTITVGIAQAIEQEHDAERLIFRCNTGTAD